MEATKLIAAITLIFLTAFAKPAFAQDQSNDQGPMAPPPKYEIKKMPSTPHPEPPPMPAPKIIQAFVQNEDAARKVYETYDFEQTIRLEELNGPGGKMSVTGLQYTRPDGQRVWRVTKPMQSDLKLTTYTLDDLRTVLTLPIFFLTSDQIGSYDLLYAGKQKVDEIDAYIFQVKPKRLDRSRLFFDGIIYVDDQDLAIVETYGKFVNEMGSNGGTKLPFTLFETFRENFQGKYWLPTYTTSDDSIDVKADEPVHLRIVVRSTDFKLNGPKTPLVLPEAPNPPNTSVNPTDGTAPAPAGPTEPADSLPRQPQSH
jgi:hypothetical protein